MRSLREGVYPRIGVTGKCVAGGGVSGCGDDVGNGRGHVDGMLPCGLAGRWCGVSWQSWLREGGIREESRLERDVSREEEEKEE